MRDFGKIEKAFHIRCIWFDRGGADRICPLGNSNRKKATVFMGETEDSAAFVVFWRNEEKMSFEAMLQEQISNISKMYLVHPELLTVVDLVN